MGGDLPSLPQESHRPLWIYCAWQQDPSAPPARLFVVARRYRVGILDPKEVVLYWRAWGRALLRITGAQIGEPWPEKPEELRATLLAEGLASDPRAMRAACFLRHPVSRPAYMDPAVALRIAVEGALDAEYLEGMLAAGELLTGRPGNVSRLLPRLEDWLIMRLRRDASSPWSSTPCLRDAPELDLPLRALRYALHDGRASSTGATKALARCVFALTEMSLRLAPFGEVKELIETALGACAQGDAEARAHLHYALGRWQTSTEEARESLQRACALTQEQWLIGLTWLRRAELTDDADAREAALRQTERAFMQLHGTQPNQLLLGWLGGLLVALGTPESRLLALRIAEMIKDRHLEGNARLALDPRSKRGRALLAEIGDQVGLLKAELAQLRAHPQGAQSRLRKLAEEFRSRGLWALAGDAEVLWVRGFDKDDYEQAEAAWRRAAADYGLASDPRRADECSQLAQTASVYRLLTGVRPDAPSEERASMLRKLARKERAVLLALAGRPRALLELHLEAFTNFDDLAEATFAEHIDRLIADFGTPAAAPPE